jgi:anti-sigma regulatory factor (Ser/Thr protein kinase)
LIIKTKSTANRFVISITDYGKSFEPNAIPEPDLQKYYRQKRVGGLGMYLMKTLMDDVKYVSIPGKHNEVLLSKNIKLTQQNVR